MNKIIYLTVLFACLTVWAKAQDTLFIQGKAYDDAITVTFFPLNPSTWVNNLMAGYRVERVEVDTATFKPVPGTRAVLVERLLPKDSAWFIEHKIEEDGLMEAIGAMLYDTTFQFSDKSLIDPDSMRWNYVMNEVQTRPMVALAAGLMVLDTTAQSGKIYRYFISSPGLPGLAAEIAVPYYSGSVVKNILGPDIEFKFPEDKSLTDMIPQLDKKVFPQVFAIARAYSDSIVVRWAPNSPELWSSSTREGYLLLRNEPFQQVDTIGLIMPWAKEKTNFWVLKHMDDSLALVAASLLYNEKAFEEPATMMEQAQVFETRYGFALFSADGSAAAGDILGLRYVDRNVEPGKTYNYTVISMASPGFFNQGQVEILNEKTEDPPPFQFEANPGDHLIELVWDMNRNNEYFTAYELERSSDDGRSWSRLHEEPLVFMESDAAPLRDYRFRDSVEMNYKDYSYRLRGLNSFGEWGQWAELKAQAIDLTPPPVADVTLSVYNDTTNTAVIQWDIAELPEDFKAFYVLVSHEVDTPYDTLAEMSRLAREFIWQPDTLLRGDRGYFFRVLTIDTRGNSDRSLERYMTVPDLIAPPPPAKLEGFISEDGTVRVVWDHSAATDLLGYWIYFANDPNDKFSILNSERLEINTYTWQVTAKSLNKVLYVVVSAEDTHFNRGRTSEVLALKRPDSVPPVVPFMLSAAQEDRNMAVKWRQSVSEDCAKYLVLRREVGEVISPWMAVDTLDAQANTYADSTCALGTWYQYAVIAEDDSGNRSDTSEFVRGRLRFLPEWAPVTGLTAVQPQPEQRTVELNWQFEPLPAGQAPAPVFEFLIYRSSGNRNLEFYSAVTSDLRSFVDNEVSKNAMYNYAVKVSYNAEYEGKMSDTKSVLVK